MAETTVPDLAITTAPTKKVVTVGSTATSAGFTVAVVREVKSGPFTTPTQIDDMTVLKQAPDPGAKLTTGQLMHLYVSGAGPSGGESANSGRSKSEVVKRIAWVEFVVILFLAVYCFVLGH